jgi:O-antigen ligase
MTESRSSFSSLPITLIFGLLFIMGDSVSALGWSIAECTLAVLLLMRIAKSDSSIIVPVRDFMTPLLMLLLWACASLLWSANIHATWTGLFKLILFTGAVVLFQNDPDAWKPVVRRALLSVSLVAALIWDILPASALGWLTHPNLYAGFIALGGILWVETWVDQEGKDRRWTLAAAGAVVFALLTLASLGPVLAWLAGSAVLLKLRGRSRLMVKIFAAVLVGLALVSLRSGASVPTLIARKSADPFAVERIQIWKDAWAYFLKHPVAGTALGTFRDYYPEYKKIAGLRNAPYAHNEPLNLLCELGLVGGAIAVWLAVPLFGFIREKARDPGNAAWTAVACGIAVQSLFDFNLHYPPILILAAFCVSVWVPPRQVEIRKSLTVALLLTWCALAALPGLAEAVFRSAQDTPRVRVAAARIASFIDPLNAFYHAQTGSMRDMLIAIDLDPRNVWYRREAARFYSGVQPVDLDSAILQYSEILRLAPQVEIFEREMEVLLERKSRTEK